MVGGMGHTSSVALGYSLSTRNKTICIDGDGSFLMHLGSIKSIATFANKNFKYIVIIITHMTLLEGKIPFQTKLNLKNLLKV